MAQLGLGRAMVRGRSHQDRTSASPSAASADVPRTSAGGNGASIARLLSRTVCRWLPFGLVGL
eukprot:5835359-Pyramimonas_sp.AAC.1